MLLRAFLCCVVLVMSPVAAASLPDFTEIVEESSPAVVKVMAEVRMRAPDSSNRMEQLEELDQLPDALKRLFQYRNPPTPRGGSGSPGMRLLQKEPQTHGIPSKSQSICVDWPAQHSWVFRWV